VPKPFIVFSLPRSRSAWLSHYLTFGGQFLVGHDIVIECDSIEQFIGSFNPKTPNALTGTCETGALLGWRLIQARLPQARLLALIRPLGEVFESFRKRGIAPDARGMEESEAMLQALSRAPGVDTVFSSDLDDPECGKWLIESLLEREFDTMWWQALRGINIQVDLLAPSQRVWERRDAMGALTRQVVEQTLALGERSKRWMT
jgi:hypothetical protein